MSTPLAAFGPGILIAQRTDITVPAAINIGYAQEFSIEVAGTTKALYGQQQYPLVGARGTMKATGKFKAAVISGFAWNALMYGQSSLSTASVLAWNVDSTFTASTAAATIAVGSSLTFDTDLGVKYAATNLPLQRVSTGSEALGKYSVSGTNVYTFSAADSTAGAAGGTNLKITYAATTGSGQILAVTNQLIGTTPTFQLDYYTNLNQPTAKPFIVRIFECIGAKHAMQFKLEDFMTPEFDFDLFADNTGRIFNCYFPEAS